MYRFKCEAKEKKTLCILHTFFHYNCFDRWALILLGGPMQEITPFSLDDLHKTECIRVQKRHTITSTESIAQPEQKKNAVWKIPCHYRCVSGECMYVGVCMCLKRFSLFLLPFFFFIESTWTTHELITCTHNTHTMTGEPHG